MAAAIITMTAVAYFTLDIPNSEARPVTSDYTFSYLLGFLTPLIGSAMVLLVACQIILGRKQKVIRVNHQNQDV